MEGGYTDCVALSWRSQLWNTAVSILSLVDLTMVDWWIDRHDTHLEQISVLERGPRVGKQCQGSVLGQP